MAGRCDAARGGRTRARRRGEKDERRRRKASFAFVGARIRFPARDRRPPAGVAAARATLSPAWYASPVHMSIERGHGDLLAADVDALVNTVNTVGVMGKGLALQVRKAFPEVFASYQQACKAGEVVVGRMHIVRRPTAPRFIVNFPTKQHWRQPSQLAYVRDGLRDLIHQIRVLQIASIAVPPLGCRLGGLDWAEVKPLIIAAFAEVPDVRAVVFEPSGARPSAR